MARNDLTGSLFADRYRLERKLGSGGMADVWLAEDQELGRRVAVKILHERYANDEQFVERFRREATHAAGLSHPNIVSIYDRGVVGRLVLHRDGVHRGPHAQGAHRDARAVPRARRDLVHPPDPRRAPLRAQERDHPPGHQAPQRPRRPRGARQGGRLRHRAGRCQRDDRGRLDRRDGAVPLARTGARRPGRRELRPLLDGHRPLRAADRHGAVHGRDARRDRDEAPFADARGAVGSASRDPAGSRPRRPSRARQGARATATAPPPSSIATSSSWRAAMRSAPRPRPPRRWSWRARARSTRRPRPRSRPHARRPREEPTAATSATGPTTAPSHGGEACGPG